MRRRVLIGRARGTSRSCRQVRLALVALVMPCLASIPAWSADGGPITIGHVFEPDLADVRSVPDIKQAADQVSKPADNGSKSSCASPEVTVTALTRMDSDANFANALGQARTSRSDREDPRQRQKNVATDSRPAPAGT